MHNKHKIAVTLAYLVLLTAISVNLFVLQYGDYDLAGKGYEVAEDCIPYDDQFDVTDLLWTDADNEIKKICLGDYVLDVPITLNSGVENLTFVCEEGTKFIAGASETAIILESGNIEINGCEFEGFGNDDMMDDNPNTLRAAIEDDVIDLNTYESISILSNIFTNNERSIALKGVKENAFGDAAFMLSYNTFQNDDIFLEQNDYELSTALYLSNIQGDISVNDNDIQNSHFSIFGKVGFGSGGVINNNLFSTTFNEDSLGYSGLATLVLGTMNGIQIHNNEFDNVMKGMHITSSTENFKVMNNVFSAAVASSVGFEKTAIKLTTLDNSEFISNQMIGFDTAIRIDDTNNVMSSNLEFNGNTFENNKVALRLSKSNGNEFVNNIFLNNAGASYDFFTNVPQWITENIFVYMDNSPNNLFRDNSIDVASESENIMFIKDSSDTNFYGVSEELVYLYDNTDPDDFKAHFFYPVDLNVIRKYSQEGIDIEEPLYGALITFWIEDQKDGVWSPGEKIILQYSVGDEFVLPVGQTLPYLYSFSKIVNGNGGSIDESTGRSYAYDVKYGRDDNGNYINLFNEPKILGVLTSQPNLELINFFDNCISPLDLSYNVPSIYEEYDPLQVLSESSCGLMGDVNEDGVISCEDQELLLSLVGGVTEDFPCADINGDNILDITDQDDFDLDYTVVCYPNFIIEENIKFCSGLYFMPDVPGGPAIVEDLVYGALRFDAAAATIDVECDKTIFSGNLVENDPNKGYGAYIDRNDVSIKDCTFSNYGSGILAQGSENLVFDGNKFVSNNYGLETKTSQSLIKFNEFSDNNKPNLKIFQPKITTPTSVYGNLFYNAIQKAPGTDYYVEVSSLGANFDINLLKFYTEDFGNIGNYWENYEEVVGEACVDVYTNYKDIYEETDLDADSFCDKFYDLKIGGLYWFKDFYPYASEDFSMKPTLDIEATVDIAYVNTNLEATTTVTKPGDELVSSYSFDWSVDEDVFDGVDEFSGLTTVNIPMHIPDEYGFLTDISKNQLFVRAGKMDGSGEHSPEFILDGAGYAAKFDPEDYIVIPYDPIFDSNEFTIEFLIKIKELEDGIIFGRPGSYNNFKVMIEDGKLMLKVKAMSEEASFEISEISDAYVGEFFSFVMLIKKTSSKINIDVDVNIPLFISELEEVPLTFEASFFNNNDWYLGGDLVEENVAFNGVIDEFKIYPYALSGDQIDSDFATYYSPDFNPTNNGYLTYEQHQTCGNWKVNSYLTTIGGELTTLETLEDVYEDFVCGYEECSDLLPCTEPKVCVEKIPAVFNLDVPPVLVESALSVCEYPSCGGVDDLGEVIGCLEGQTCMEGKCLVCTDLTDGMDITEDTLLCGETYEIMNGITIKKDNVQLICSDDTKIIGDGTGYGIDMEGVVGAQIINCDISNFIGAISLVNSEGCYIRDNYIHDNVNYGIGFGEGVKDVIIENNIVENSWFGLLVYDTSQSTFTYDSIDIKDSVFTKNQFNLFTLGVPPKVRIYDSVLNESKIHLDFSSNIIDFGMLNKEHGDILFAIETDPLLEVPEFDFYNTDFDDVVFFGTDVLDLSDVVVETSLGTDDAQSVLEIFELVETAPGEVLTSCLALTNVTVRDYCIKELAFTTETITYCTDITDDAQNDHCYVYFVFKDVDYTLCNNVIDPIIKTKCDDLAVVDPFNKNAIINRYWGLDVYVVKPDSSVVEQAGVELTHYDAENENYILLDTDGDGLANMEDVVYTNSEGVAFLWLLANITDKNQAETIKDDNPYRITVSEGTVSPEPAFSETFTIKESMFKQIDLIAGIEVSLVAKIDEVFEEQTQTGGGGSNKGSSCAPKFDASCSLKHKTTACVKQGGLNYSTKIFTCTSTNGCGTKLIVEKCDGIASSFTVSCDNKIKDIGEEGIDCGGPCQDICPSTCSDFKKNQDETDIDCGGMKCPQCKDNKNCDLDNDCLSGYCDGICKQATCYDDIQNQDEIDVDCGGSCGDCGGETCYDDIQNQDETGIDCGGSCEECVIPTVVKPMSFNYYWFLLLLIPLISGLLFVGLKLHKSVPKTDVLQPFGIPKKIPSPEIETTAVNVARKEVVLDRKLIAEVKQKLSSGKSKAQIIKESKYSKQDIEQLFKVGVSFILPEKYNKDLKKYINHYYAKGMSKKGIASNLIKKGWNKELVGGVLYPSSVKVTFKGSTELPEEVAAQLKKYVAHYRKKGMANDLIKKNLIKVGWKKELIEKIIK